MEELINTGYQPSEYVKNDHYVLGGYSDLASRPIVNPTGKWTPYLPSGESQSPSPGFGDTHNCTAFGTFDCLEPLMRCKFNIDQDNSERFLGIVAGTSIVGNDPHTVAEALRKNGSAKEATLPYDAHLANQAAYYSPKPPPARAVAEAQQWLGQWDFKHEWAVEPGTKLDLKNQQELLKTALKLSPVGVGLCAWYERNNMYYRPEGAQDNHWAALVDYEEGQYWVVFDSYSKDGTFLKKLEWNYPFGDAKVYYIDNATPKLSIMAQILALIAKILNIDAQIVANRKNGTEVTPVLPPPATTEKLFWDTPEQAKHSVRVICDEEGLPFYLKNIMTDCVEQESGFRTQAKHENKNRQGVTTSTDWGIAQINDYYNIGPGKPFSSVAYVLANPEADIRWMARMFKAGKANLWSSYSTGAYLNISKGRH